MTSQSEARDRAIEVVFEELDQHAGSAADAAEWAVDALLARPEVLRALADVPSHDEPVTDDKARKQAASAMRRVAAVFKAHDPSTGQQAAVWAMAFEDAASCQWTEAARALLSATDPPEEATVNSELNVQENDHG